MFSVGGEGRWREEEGGRENGGKGEGGEWKENTVWSLDTSYQAAGVTHRPTDRLRGVEGPGGGVGRRGGGIEGPGGGVVKGGGGVGRKREEVEEAGGGAGGRGEVWGKEKGEGEGFREEGKGKKGT